MANITFPRKEFEKLLGKSISKEIEKQISLFGTPVESLSEDEIELEIFPNRPDLLSMHGFVRAFKSFTGKESGLKRYTLQRPKKEYSVTIDPSVADVRPHTACAIVTGLSLTDEHIKELVTIQEKIHVTFGRNRKKVAIGVYPLEKIRLPIRYEARKPAEINFVPLESKRKMNATQILRNHPKGKEYANLLKGKARYPVFVDANNAILSMPPIINSHETGKVDETTKQVFVECSGFDQKTLNKTLNILVAHFADVGGTIHAMHLIRGKTRKITPDLAPQKMKLSVERANKLLGLTLTEKQIVQLLKKMGHGHTNKTVLVPAWRTDVLHEVDLIEDIAIAYGYDRFVPEIPDVATIGMESRESKLKSKISEVLIGRGLLEVSSYHLIKPSEAKRLQYKEVICVKDSKTEYKVLRPNLLIPMLRILGENKDSEYPQCCFEIGSVFSKHSGSETGIREETRLVMAFTPGNFTQAKQHLDYLFKLFGLTYTIRAKPQKGCIDGRSGSIMQHNTEIGYVGEVHPQTLNAWNLKMPLSIVELNVDRILESIE